MLGTPVTTVRDELEGRIHAIDSEVKRNELDIDEAKSTIGQRERQIGMLTKLRAEYVAIVGTL